MALTPPLLASSLLASRTAGAFPFGGLAFDALAQGIASGVCAWAISQPQNLALVGASTGTAGAGIILPVTTRLTVPPNVPGVLAALTAAGLNGPLGLALATVVTAGIAGSFTAYGQYTGTSAGVGVGADISKVVVANPATLMATLAAAIGPMYGTGGPALGMLCAGLANGISALLLGGTGIGSVTGPPSPSGGVGVTNSVVI